MSDIGFPVLSAVATVTVIPVPEPNVVALRGCVWTEASLIVVFPVFPALWSDTVIAESTADPACEPTVTLSVAAPPVVLF